jgi:hypothetical protein
VRRSIVLPVIVAVLAACSHPSSTPRGGGAAASTAPADRNPCEVAGRCTIQVEVPIEVVNALDHAGVNFRVYVGCPRALGFRDLGNTGRASDNTVIQPQNTSMRAAVPIAHTTSSEIVMPQLAGRYATVAIFFAADPGKYAVVDFGRGPTQKVKFGYTITGQGIINDNNADSENRSAERRYCS